MNIPQHRPETKIIEFPLAHYDEIKNHVREVRRLFDWPGLPYHDSAAEPAVKFNRWFWHNAPLLKFIHQNLGITELASKLAGISLKPSYCFLSMYGPEGVCPLHSDRPQCQFTLDLLVNYHGEKPWPIYIEDQSGEPTEQPDGTQWAARPYVLKPREALFYSGTGQRHYRKSGTEVGLVKADLVFFHFVPISYMGGCD